MPSTRISASTFGKSIVPYLNGLQSMPSRRLVLTRFRYNNLKQIPMLFLPSFPKRPWRIPEIYHSLQEDAGARNNQSIRELDSVWGNRADLDWGRYFVREDVGERLFVYTVSYGRRMKRSSWIEYWWAKTQLEERREEILPWNSSKGLHGERSVKAAIPNTHSRYVRCCL